jgi:hypothetical protein
MGDSNRKKLLDRGLTDLPPTVAGSTVRGGSGLLIAEL